MTNLISLAERVERLAGPCRETDALIAVSTCGFFEVAPKWEGGPIGYGYIDADGCRVEPGHGGDQLVRRYTASIDTAMTLVPPHSLFIVKTLWDGEQTCGYAIINRYAVSDTGKMWAGEITGLAATPALALLSACLRSLARMKEEEL